VAVDPQRRKSRRKDLSLEGRGKMGKWADGEFYRKKGRLPGRSKTHQKEAEVRAWIAVPNLGPLEERCC